MKAEGTGGLALYDPAPSLASLEQFGAAIGLADGERRRSAVEDLYARFAEPA